MDKNMLLTMQKYRYNTGYVEAIRFICPACGSLGSFFTSAPKFCTACGQGFVYLFNALWHNQGEERLQYYRRIYHG